MLDLFETLGSEVRVNGGQFSYFGQQSAPQAVRLANGDLLVVFVDAFTPSQLQIKTQRYDAAGNTIGFETIITSGLTGTFTDPAITALSGGGYAIAYVRQAVTGAEREVYVRSFDFSGVATGSPVQIAPGVTGEERSPAIAALAGGGFVTVWTAPDSNGSGIFMQRFDAAGTAVGGVSAVNSGTASDQLDASVALLDGGGFVITWKTDTNGLTAGDIFARVFDASGVAQGNDIAINLTTAADQGQPAIVALPGGGFAVAWTSVNQDRPGGSGVVVQRFDANGLRLGSETVVNSFVDGAQSAPAIARLASGDFVVTWTSTIHDGSGSGIYGQVYSAAGVAQGGEFRASTAVTGDQTASTLVATADGGFAAIYQSPDPSFDGIYMQRYAPNAVLTEMRVAGTLSIAETAFGNALVANLSTNQANDTTSYTIVSDSSGGAFGISGNRLIVADNGWLDFETQASITLTLRATSANGQQIDKQVTVQVSNGADEAKFVGNAIQASYGTGGIGGDEGIRAIALSGGGFAVAWVDSNLGQFHSQSAVSVRILDASGTVVGQWQSALQSSSLVTGPVLTALAGNAFAVGWTFSGFSMQFFDGSGSASGSTVTVDPSAGFRDGPNDMVRLADGTLLAVSYHLDPVTSQTDIMTRHIAANGQLLGSATVVTSTAAREYYPSATALADGGYVLGWIQDIPGSTGFQGYVQRFDANGSPLAAAQQVGPSQASGTALDVSSLASGGFVVVFGGVLSGQTASGLFQIYDAAGNAVGSPQVFIPNLGTSGFESSIAGTPDGGFVIEYLANSELRLQRFAADGAEVTPATLLGETPYSRQSLPELAVAANGSFIAAWSDPNGDTTNGYVDRVWQTYTRELLYGTEVADNLAGGSANERLFGYGGNDTLIGGGGTDQIYGGAGDDRLVFAGSSSANIANGGSGIDTLAISGAVSFSSFAGIEAIELSTGSNLTLTTTQVMSGLAPNTQLSGSGTITVNLEANVFTALTGFQGPSTINFVLNGSAGDDYIKAAHFNNTINGGVGRDFIRGGNGVDTIDGGADNDKITGWGGADILTGGSGADQFRYFYATDSGLGAASDRITDFTIGSDVIDLRLLDKDLVTPDIQNYALSFIGSAAFGAGGTSQIRYATSGADMLVQFDLDGNGTSDMEIVLQGLAGQTLTVNDFLGVSAPASGGSEVSGSALLTSDPLIEAPRGMLPVMFDNGPALFEAQHAFGSLQQADLLHMV